jgi:hypothetical protein
MLPQTSAYPQYFHEEVYGFALYSSPSVVITSSMRYTFKMMSKNSPQFTVLQSGVFKRGQRSAPYIPGLLLILLGVAVVVAPKLILGIAAAFIVALGAIFCYIAYKFIGLRKQFRNLAKNFQGPMYEGDFTSEKPDIDITELEEKKIVYH